PNSPPREGGGFLGGGRGRRGAVWGQTASVPFLVGYKVGTFAGPLVRRLIVLFAYSGIPGSVLEAPGRAFAQSYLPNTLRGEAMQRIAWHHAQGHPVVVVSGGLEAYLEPGCDSHRRELHWSSLQQSEGSRTGPHVGRPPASTGKARWGPGRSVPAQN
ncbi:haloacid dehalogenase-like hydrolase, partial [Escherichia coli]|nr:haloacid dehalogenase-like hydrolase [Escherichia coli]